MAGQLQNNKSTLTSVPTPLRWSDSPRPSIAILFMFLSDQGWHVILNSPDRFINPSTFTQYRCRAGLLRWSWGNDQLSRPDKIYNTYFSQYRKSVGWSAIKFISPWIVQRNPNISIDDLKINQFRLKASLQYPIYKFKLRIFYRLESTFHLKWHIWTSSPYEGVVIKSKRYTYVYLQFCADLFLELHILSYYT